MIIKVLVIVPTHIQSGDSYFNHGKIPFKDIMSVLKLSECKANTGSSEAWDLSMTLNFKR